MHGQRFRFKAILFLFIILGPSVVTAHDLPLNTVMSSFVKIEPHQAELVIRVPLDLLHSIPFPINGPTYDLTASGPARKQALDTLAAGLTIQENGAPLVPSAAIGKLVLPSDRSFQDYDSAVAQLSKPNDPTEVIYFDQGYFDAHFTYPITSPKSVFSIQTTVAADLSDFVKLTVRYMPLDESSRAFIITAKSGRVSLDPAWYQASGSFVTLGIEHILSGIDHLLFLFCLVIPFRRLRGLIPVITMFTLAHSLTLLGSAYHLAPQGAWFPPFVETAIAASIVYMALENIVGADLRHRWLITGVFGLVHGFGFSHALQTQLQFAGSHLLVSLFSFNIGIEIGQLFVLALMLPLLALFRRIVPDRMGVIVLSAIAAHTGWHWMLERWDVLRQTPWPPLDAASLVIIARWSAAVLLAAGIARLLANRIGHRYTPQVEPTH
jgi:hypothetical protein